MESVGLGWDVIHERNPRLVMTSITPFGQDGPYANWRATDLIGVAMGGLASLCGSPGRPPIRPSAAQGYTQACAQAVVGTMIAHYHRTRTGRGQHVDQSMQEAVTYHARQRHRRPGTFAGSTSGGPATDAISAATRAASTSTKRPTGTSQRSPMAGFSA